jgi:hypothetical protein
MTSAPWREAATPLNLGNEKDSKYYCRPHLDISAAGELKNGFARQRSLA